MKKMECDVVIAGCGVAGLFSALHLPKNQKIIMLSKEDIKHVDFFLEGLKLKLAFVNLNIPCKLTLGQAPSKKDKSKRIFARIKSIRIINGLDSDLKIDKPVYDIELKLIGVNRGKN